MKRPESQPADALGPLGLVFVGSLHHKVQVECLLTGLELTANLQIKPSLAIAPQGMVNHKPACKTAQDWGVEWLSSPFFGFLRDETAGIWPVSAYAEEAQSAQKLNRELGLDEPIGLLLPFGECAKEVQNQLTNFPQIEVPLLLPTDAHPLRDLDAKGSALFGIELETDKGVARSAVALGLEIGSPHFLDFLNWVCLRAESKNGLDLCPLSTVLSYRFQSEPSVGKGVIL